MNIIKQWNVSKDSEENNSSMFRKYTISNKDRQSLKNVTLTSMSWKENW